jgi:hypothetical protein
MHKTVIHFATPEFWQLYQLLPQHVRRTADHQFNMLKQNPNHPSLHLKKIAELWSVRAGLHYRALGIDIPDGQQGILWFWIGSHAQYDRMVHG